MISLTTEQLQKIELVDALFSALDIDQIKELAESEQVVAKLKGVNLNPGLLKNIVQESEIHSVEMMRMASEVTVLKADMQTLVRAVITLVNTPPPYSQDLQNLKSKYNVY
jgi:hypothetical protein